MIGYIIGIVLGAIIFLFQNFKPTSIGFRIMFFLLSIAFIWGIYYANLGYWNILIIPIGEFVLGFISAFCFPYTGKSASIEYETINGENYYAKLHNNEKIDRIQPPGFKQTYDRIISGILHEIVTNKDDFNKLEMLLYSKNFYPISIRTKEEVLQHINTCIEKVANSSRHGGYIRTNANKRIGQLFNAYVSVMAIHETATRNLEQSKKRNISPKEDGHRIVDVDRLHMVLQVIPDPKEEQQVTFLDGQQVRTGRYTCTIGRHFVVISDEKGGYQIKEFNSMDELKLAMAAAAGTSK